MTTAPASPDPAAPVLPDRVRDTAQLEALLSEPTAGVIETFARLPGDLVVLGAAGKMGPSLARMARRAAEAAGTARRVIAVSRFSEAGAEAGFRAHGIETIRCDLLDAAQVARLPDAPNVLFMAGMKFGSTGQEALTWAMNAHLPALVCERFRGSRIAAFSTGNVYGLTPLALGGSTESDPPAPVGEYAMSCLGRERIFEHFSRAAGTPVALLRLNYAAELRYGVLADVARRVRAGEPVALGMGAVNVLWQGDANALALQSLAHAASPPLVLNLAGPEQLSVRRLAMQFGELLGQQPVFAGEEAATALLSNGQLAHDLLGLPRVPARRLIRWTADWIERGGESLGKPTHFEVRDGKF
jgi:nucleoside-diphosphate-sugar epimerase